MNPQEILLKVAAYLENNCIPYAVVGGYAAIAWGRMRSTYDIDLIIDQDYLEIASFVTFLQSINLLADAQDIQSAFRERSHSSILFKESPAYRIVLKGIYFPEDREAIQTAKPVKYKGQIIHFGSPENLIAHKLKFGSDKDMEDALVVLLVQEDSIDWNYLDNLAVRLGVKHGFAELLKLKDEKET
ncbi:MAG: hypothetical protein ACFFD4_31475 [Candidatus Odinarchaeota archaeon]